MAKKKLEPEHLVDPDGETIDTDDDTGFLERTAAARSPESDLLDTQTLAVPRRGAASTVDDDGDAGIGTGEDVDDGFVPPATGLEGKLASLWFAPNRDGMAFALALSVAAAMILPFLGRMGFFDPWESHYAEVARQMAQRDDYLYPYWKDGYFFSKPILLFWLTGPLYALAGAGKAEGALPASVELLGRLPIAMMALLCVGVVWFAARRLWGRRAGTLAAIVLATTPFFALIARQAITDMLYVGPLSAAICLLAVAFFDDETRDQLKEARLPWWLVSMFAVCLLPQLWEIGRSGAFLNRVTTLGSEFTTRLAFSLVLTGAGAAGLFLLFKKGKDPLIHTAAVLCALGTLGKGPHTVVFTGLPFFLYFVVSGEWRLLRRPALLTGIALYLAVAAPWPTVMMFFDGKDGGKTWFVRFVLHDLFGRLGGVHGERGTFDYYVRYFAFGTFPWAPLVPIAVLRGASRRLGRPEERTKADRFTLLCVIWAVALFAFFTATNTKFHHYIFPVVVPGALLVGRWLDELLSSRHRIAAGIGIFAILGVAAVGRDLVTEPWQIADLFSYHYVSYKPAYYFPDDLWWRISLGVVAGLAALFIFVGMVSDVALGRFGRGGRSAIAGPEGASVIPAAGAGGGPSRGGGWLSWPSRIGAAALTGGRSTFNAGFVAAVLCGGFLFCMYATHVYQANASQHWSHRHLLDTYWSMKQPGDRLVSYQMDWKGETFYAHNTEEQIKKGASRLKQAVEAPGRCFVLVQQDRFARIESAIGKEYKDKIRVVDRSNKKWFLVLVED